MIEDNTFNQDLTASISQKKYNRKEFRRLYGGKSSSKRSKLPRYVASRKIKPMPDNWQGWKNWKPKKKAV